MRLVLIGQLIPPHLQFSIAQCNSSRELLRQEPLPQGVKEAWFGRWCRHPRLRQNVMLTKLQFSLSARNLNCSYRGTPARQRALSICCFDRQCGLQLTITEYKSRCQDTYIALPVLQIYSKAHSFLSLYDTLFFSTSQNYLNNCAALLKRVKSRKRKHQYNLQVLKCYYS